jgi:hypothetical protein
MPGSMTAYNSVISDLKNIAELIESALQNLCSPHRCWPYGVNLAGGFP